MVETPDLKALAGKTPEELYAALKTTKDGLTPAEAAQRLREYGPNEFVAKKKLQPVFIFLSKFKNPLLILLIAAAIVSAVLGSRLESYVILVMVFGSAIIDFINTYRSAKAAEKLESRVNVTAAVFRGGTLEEKNLHDIVPGDIVVLEAGDLVPADSVLVEAKDLFLNESILTGESLPAEKELASPAARMLFLGTSVVAGSGTAVAVITGKKTKIGVIAGQLKRPDVPTEFEKNLKDFSLFLFRTTLFLVLALILVNIFVMKHDVFEVFLFAVAIAVGLTPELLPVIVTTNLAKGALKMEKDGVIVKKLAALHNFGSIDILCTDKTGTLTEDRITLIKCVDGFGKESDETLFWGYMGSTHRTGIRGVLDHAIQAYRKVDVAGWEKVDEVPFDPIRRTESVVVRKGDETVLVAKGAPEEILKNSEKLGAEEKEKIMHEYEALSSDGFRVLAVGTKKVPVKSSSYSKADEKDLSFVGYLAFLDPPKRTVKETLQKMEDHNVAIKIITGDNILVTKKIAEEIGFAVQGALTGDDLAKLGEHQFKTEIEKANVFTRVTPEQKELIVRTLRANGHVVAFMGDGVNDVLAMKEADVGISVNNAVDIAKETADIILMKTGLREIIDGVVEGRKTFANTFKYLMIALSSNFGNMFSMPVASLFLPFLPMTAPQILLNNFMYDSSQLAIPFDNVEPEYLTRPKKFNLGFMKRFMIIFGPISSCFDFATFGALLLILHAPAAGFQTGWFLESIATQTLVVGVVRNRGSFWKTRPSTALIINAVAAVTISWIIPYSFLGVPFGFVKFGWFPLVLIACIVTAYLFATEFAKKWFYRTYGNLIEK
jgi:Mg2+-importing ATPase